MLSNTLANIPATALKGTLFVATDTFALYRYDGSTWALIGGPGTGTITGSGANGQLAYFNASSVLTSSSAFTVSGNRMTIQELSTNTDGFLNGVLFGAGGGNKNSNTRAGNGALQSGTAGADGYSVAVGFSALQASSTPSYVVAVGARALEKETGGSGNTAVGALAMFESSGSFWNTAMGYGALHNQTTGNLNVAIGYFAQEQSALNLNRNTSVGAYSLQWLASSGNNVGIGYNAGSMTANGNPNAAINQCVYIGSDSKGVSGTGGVTNEIVIGYNAIGNGFNSVTIGNNSILNTYLKGTVNANHIAVTKTASGISINITDSANGNALNINKTGSGFAVNVDAGVSNFQNVLSTEIISTGNITSLNTIRTTGNGTIVGGGQGVEVRYIGGFGEIYTYDRTGLAYLPTKIDGAALYLNSKSTASNVIIGSPTDDLTNKLQVNGDVKASSFIVNSITTNSNAVIQLLTIKSVFNIIVDGVNNGGGTVVNYTWNDGGQGPLKFNDATGTVFTLDTNRNGVFTNSIVTGNPTGGTAAPWKLGSYNAASLSVTSGYVEIDIAGVAYKLALVN